MSISLFYTNSDKLYLVAINGAIMADNSAYFRKIPTMAHLNDVSGTAALAICESLLLALNDRNILPEAEIVGILKDAALAHHHAATDDGRTELHAAVAKLITGIIDGGNSVRRR
jgi:hypothetical protein